MAQVFERENCTRCHGSGHYSWCQQYGSKCFKCGGKGVTLSKRGQATAAWYAQQNKINLLDIQIGDRIDLFGQIFTVKEIFEPKKSGFSKRLYHDKVDTYSHMFLSISGRKYGVSTGHPNDTEVRRILSGSARDEMLKKAAEFQKTLTKAGNVKKRKPNNVK